MMEKPKTKLVYWCDVRRVVGDAFDSAMEMIAPAIPFLLYLTLLAVAAWAIIGIGALLRLGWEMVG